MSSRVGRSDLSVKTLLTWRRLCSGAAVRQPGGHPYRREDGIGKTTEGGKIKQSFHGLSLWRCPRTTSTLLAFLVTCEDGWSTNFLPSVQRFTVSGERVFGSHKNIQYGPGNQSDGAQRRNHDIARKQRPPAARSGDLERQVLCSCFAFCSLCSHAQMKERIW